MSARPQTPELDRYVEACEHSGDLGDFLDFLLEKFVLAKLEPSQAGRSTLLPVGHIDRERLLAEFYGLDLDQVERERAALYAWLRAEVTSEAVGEGPR